MLVVPGAASAQGRLEAQYEASLAGIVVGKGAWTIEIGEDSYVASAYGGTSGLLKTMAIANEEYDAIEAALEKAKSNVGAMIAARNKMMMSA